MNPIQPAELSAYLDGELDAARAKEIETAMSVDPFLRAEYETLKANDAKWTASARTAVARPIIELKSNTDPLATYLRAIASVAGLLALRFVPKLSNEIMWGVALHSVVFAVILIWIVRIARSDEVVEEFAGPPN